MVSVTVNVVNIVIQNTYARFYTLLQCWLICKIDEVEKARKLVRRLTLLLNGFVLLLIF